MAHPLVNTLWQDPIGLLTAITIKSDADFQQRWLVLRDHYIPTMDYTFKYSGMGSTYLLAAVIDSDKATFLNITKNNKQRPLPLDSGLIAVGVHAPSGLLKAPIHSQAAIVSYTGSVTPLSGGGQIVITGSPTNVPKAPPPKTLHEIILKKITSPKQRCNQCGGNKTLLFNTYSCDNGCK